MNFQDSISSGSQESLAGGTGGTGSTPVSGTTGSICPKDGLYKATDNKAQYVELMAAGDQFPPFPGGKGNKTTTWYLVQATTTSSTTSGGTVITSDDNGFKSVLVDAGTA